jgi:membrane protein required for colicin V production
MVLDIVYALILLLAMVHGYRKGIIHSIVSLIALIVGLLAAVRFSELAAVYIDKWFNISGKYLPLIAFIAVFIGLYLLFRLLEQALEGFFKLIKLNFINQLVGALIWGLVWTMLYSTILFYLNNMGLFSDELKNDSVTYEKILPIAPDTFELIGKVIPPVKNTYNSLDAWFEELHNKRAASGS